MSIFYSDIKNFEINEQLIESIHFYSITDNY